MIVVAVVVDGWKKIQTQEDSAQLKYCRRFGPKTIRPTYERRVTQELNETERISDVVTIVHFEFAYSIIVK